MTELETLITRLHAHGYPAAVESTGGNNYSLFIPFTENPNGPRLAIGPVDETLAPLDYWPTVEDHPCDGYLDWVENHADYCPLCADYSRVCGALENALAESLESASPNGYSWPEAVEVCLLPALTELARVAVHAVHGAGNSTRPGSVLL